jgi:O-antigen/teichoic acid export membrane protein
MSLTRRITTAVASIWLSRAMAVAMGLVLMPIMFRHLEPSQLGLWLLLNQAGLMILLLDIGVTSTLTRRFAFARARAVDSLDVPIAAEAAAEMGDLIATARGVYRGIAAIMGGLAFLVGWLFIGTLDLGDTTVTLAVTAWGVICIGQTIGLNAGFWSALVAGLGYVAQTSAITMIFTLLTAVGQIVVVLMGGGLTALALVTVCGNLLGRMLTIRFLRRREPGLFAQPGRWRADVARSLVGPSVRYWCTEIGAMMLMRTAPYFIAGMQDASRVPLYQGAYILVSNLAVVAIAVGDATNIYVSHLWREDDPGRVHKLVLTNMRAGLGIMLCGTALLILLGETIITLWLGSGHFIGTGVLATMCLMFALYTQQSLMFGFSRATENEIYGRWYLAAGLLNIALSWVLIGPLGLWGVALATLLAQLPTTSWYILHSGLRRLNIPMSTYLTGVIRPVALFFLVCCGVLGAIAWVPSDMIDPVGRTALAIVACCLLCLGGGWSLLLEHAQRSAVHRHLNGRVRRWFVRNA